MKAIIVRNLGDPSVLTFETVPDPQVESKSVKIDVRASGLNFIDVYHRTGIYKKNLPFIPGEEPAGVISDVGKEVRDHKEGDRVAYVMIPGSYAEKAVVPAERLVILPKEIDFNTAAACMLQGLTAHY